MINQQTLNTVLKFLLIDDDADDRDLFFEALYEIDPEIICNTAGNARKGLAMLDNDEVSIPDIIFLDINMPIMNGWQCLAILQQNEKYNHIPVIMYSTTSHAEDIEKAHHNGAFCFFSKPTSFNKLKQSLELIVGYLKVDKLASLKFSSKVFAFTTTN